MYVCMYICMCICTWIDIRGAYIICISIWGRQHIMHIILKLLNMSSHIFVCMYACI